MAKRAAKVVNLSIGGVALEPYAKNIGLDVTQELPNVTALSDVGPRVVVGNYDFKASLDGAADFDAGGPDATIFALVGSTATHAMALQPTGTTEGPNDPNFDAADVALASYSIKAAVGADVSYSAAFQGNSALQRLTT